MDQKYQKNIENDALNSLVATTKLSPDVLSRLDREAARQERTRSDLMRVLLKRALASTPAAA